MAATAGEATRRTDQNITREMRSLVAAYDRAGVRDLALSKADLEALIPVIEGRMPIIAVVQKASDIRAVLKFAREEKIKARAKAIMDRIPAGQWGTPADMAAA